MDLLQKRRTVSEECCQDYWRSTNEGVLFFNSAGRVWLCFILPDSTPETDIMSVSTLSGPIIERPI